MSNNLAMTRSKFNRPWMFYWLFAAGIYNLVWGAWVVLFPNLSMTWLGAEPVQPPEIWQCVGMIVGVYGIGYIAASADPLRHWPIVLVGFLGKVFGPLGFIKALWDGIFPLSFALNIVFNDLIWWVPFFLMLRASHLFYNEARQRGGDLQPEELAKRLGAAGIATAQKSLLVVAMRHTGCTFTRELLATLEANAAGIKDKGWELVLVHMGRPGELAPQLQTVAPSVAYRDVADPERHIYRALGVAEGGLPAVFGWLEWRRGVQGMLKGYGIGPLVGNGFQLSGAVVLDDGMVKMQHQSCRASELPPISAWLADTD